ncbi:Uncharacterized membrane protein YjcC [Raoultella terrigena]|uniref:Uncharacterized membrane protein YjcC n=1 Tax=Raoultella terrigena TaxID=577 RepID=A0A4U9DAD2_RAOTE|nr:Uncharacterized membrane protein YjcC [Raoultella terrigena]
MTTRHLVSLVTGVLILAIILPTGLSIWLATSQAKTQFYSELDNYSARVLTRVQQVADQAKEALQEAEAIPYASCSPQHLQAMRRIAYTHRYVQEVLWLHDSVPQCSSLEDRSAPVKFPEPDSITSDGYRAWLTTLNDLGMQRRMTALGSDNHMVMIDPASFIDVVQLSPDEIHTVLFGTRRERAIVSSEKIDPLIWEKIKNQSAKTLTLDNTVFRIHRIPELGLGIATWSSTLPLQERWRHQLLLWGAHRPVYQPAGLIFNSAAAASTALAALWDAGCPELQRHPGLLSADCFAAEWQKSRGQKRWRAGSSPTAAFCHRIFLSRSPSKPG